MIKRVSVIAISLSFFTFVQLSAAIPMTNIGVRNSVYLAEFFNPFGDIANEVNSGGNASNSAENEVSQNPDTISGEDVVSTMETFDPFANIEPVVDSVATERFAITIDGIERYAEYDTENEYYIIYDNDGNKLGYSEFLNPPVTIISFDNSGNASAQDDFQNAFPPVEFETQNQDFQNQDTQTDEAKGNPTTSDSRLFVPAILVLSVVIFIMINTNILNKREL